MLPEGDEELDVLLKDFRRGVTAHARQEYPYALYIPPDYDPGSSWPLVLFLYGAGECGRDGLLHLTSGIADALVLRPGDWPCLVLLPQKPEVYVPWAHLEGLLFFLLASLQDRYAVDPDRMYLTGISRAGTEPGHWARATRTGSRRWPRLRGRQCGDRSRSARLPIWAFDGERDRIAPVSESRKMVEPG